MKVKELWEKVNFENDGKIADFLFYLRNRWQDEKEYEDINEYLTAFQKHVPEAYKISKRPFGVTCKCEDGDLALKVVTSGNYLKLAGSIKRKK